MAPPRMPNSTTGSGISTAYSLSLLSEYTHTLDSLPLDLSRNFADLRELDAVLSSSMSSITAKIHALTLMLEQPDAQMSKQERLWLLSDIADEAARLKLGGEDKIRVACQAGDALKSHTAHLDALMDHMPSFDRAILNRRTTYPHVAQRSFNPAPTLESGRRRRGGYGSLLVSAPDPSPAKRKRAVRDDDVERSPRKDKPIETSNHRARNGNGRSRKVERAASPTESLMSTASHIPSHQQAPTSHAARNNHKRTRPSAHTAHENHNGSLLDQTVARREMFHTAPSSSATHPSLPLPYGGGNGNPYEHIPQLPLPSHTEWTPAPTQLEGPGMPVARGASLTHTGMPITAPIVVPQPQQPPQPPAPGEEDGEGEVDNKVYCFCQTVSYGEMIGCDDMDCPHEWFHLSCVGLDETPRGSWYCDTCRAKRERKGPRGGKRRAGGGAGRSGAKAANGA